MRETKSLLAQMKMNDQLGRNLMEAGAVLGLIGGIILSAYLEEGGAAFIYNMLACSFIGIMLAAVLCVIAESFNND